MDGSKYSTNASSHPDHWQLIVVVSGDLAATYTTCKIVAEQGQIILSSPGMGSHMRMTRKTQAIDIQFSAIPSPGWPVPWSFLTLPIAITTEVDPRVLELPQQMAHHSKVEGDTRWIDFHWAMQARFLVDQTLWEAIVGAFQTQQIECPPAFPAWLTDAVKVARDKLSDPSFQVEAFAKLAGCSTNHLNRTIRETDGSTSRAFLRRMRIERASHILQNDPTASSNWIARQCGFTGARQLRDLWLLEVGGSLNSYRKGLTTKL